MTVSTLQHYHRRSETKTMSEFHTHAKAPAKTIAGKVTAWKLTKAVIMFRVVLFVRWDSFRRVLFLADVSVNNDNDWRARYEFGETPLILFKRCMCTRALLPFPLLRALNMAASSGRSKNFITFILRMEILI